MWRYILQRLIALVPVVFIVSVVTFAFIHLLPGDPVVALIGPEAGSASPELIAARKHDLGLDRSLPVQYLDWLGNAVRGDLGQSAVTKQEVKDALGDRFPVTLHLAVASFVVAVAIALPTGIISAYKRNSLLDRVMTILALTGVAMPSFWLGILLILLFAVQLQWLPPSGFVSITTDPIECLKHLILPAISLGTVQAAVIMRQVRSSLLEVFREDYVRTARAKGLNERRVTVTHALRNALLPVVTIIGIQVSALLGGSVVTETVFAMPGMGRYAVDAIFIRDYPVVQAVVLVTALVVVTANLITDLSYAFLDPRITYR
ncbi:MAG: nickel ABC transporter permease [Dehalococcoidia bacterium]